MMSSATPFTGGGTAAASRRARARARRDLGGLSRRRPSSSASASQRGRRAVGASARNGRGARATCGRAERAARRVRRARGRRAPPVERGVHAKEAVDAGAYAHDDVAAVWFGDLALSQKRS